MTDNGSRSGGASAAEAAEAAEAAAEPAVAPEAESSAVATPTATRRAASRLADGQWPAWFQYLAAGVGSFAGVALLMRLWRASLTTPFYYQGDALAVSAHFKTVLETGWYENQPLLGTPDGQHYHDFPTADNLHLMWARVLGLFTDNFAVSVNVYYLLGFVLTGVTAVYFLRVCRVSPAMTVALAILYALAPYHFMRNVNHLWLASYYAIPLAMVVVIRIARGEPLFTLREHANPVIRVIGSRAAATVASLAVVATSSSYYAVFTVVLIAAAGIVAFIRDRQWRLFLGAVAAGIVVCIAVGLNMLPDFLYSWQNGPNNSALLRNRAETEFFSVKFASLILPAVGHPLAAFAKLRALYDAGYPLPGEWPALGLIASLGFLALLVVLVINALGSRRTSASGPTSPVGTIRALTVLSFLAFMAATVGGFSTFVSFLTPDLRGWNRMSIIIALFGLAGFGLLIDQLWRYRSTKTSRSTKSSEKNRVSSSASKSLTRTRRSAVVPLLTAAAVLLVGGADQAISPAIPPYGASAADYQSDETFVAQLEASVPTGSMIFQLPYIDFPESSFDGTPDVVQLRLYLHAKALRFSGGGIKGRPTSDWGAGVSHDPVPLMVNKLATVGFAGIVMDRTGVAGGLDRLTEQLTSELGEPTLESPDERFVYYSLAAAAERVAGQASAADLAAQAALITNPVLPYPGSDWGLGYGTELVGPNGAPMPSTPATDPDLETLYPLYQSRPVGGQIAVVNDRGVPTTVTMRLYISSLNEAPDTVVSIAGQQLVTDLTQPDTAIPQHPDLVNQPAPTVVVEREITLPPGVTELGVRPGPATAEFAVPSKARYAVSHIEFIDASVTP